MLREYGGCLPPERFLMETPVNCLDGRAVLLNSGRAAIYLAAVHAGSTRVYLPYYTCPTIKEFLESRGIRVEEYSIGLDFLPLAPPLREGETVVWTDF